MFIVVDFFIVPGFVSFDFFQNNNFDFFGVIVVEEAGFRFGVEEEDVSVCCNGDSDGVVLLLLFSIVCIFLSVCIIGILVCCLVLDDLNTEPNQLDC